MVYPDHSACDNLPASITVQIDERDVLKIILEFLESRQFHITQLSLERETGIINGRYTDDMLFLRQLILDGEWDSAIRYIEPLKELDGFQEKKFLFLINKYKYFELLCIKREHGPLGDLAVEDIVECLKELEKLCERGDEFRQLCALLTLPKKDHEHFANWNPSSARVECFHAILPLVENFIDALSNKDNEKSDTKKTAEADRLLNLLVKGILYEYAVDYCQEQALKGKNAAKPKSEFNDLFYHQMKLSSTDLSLISWLERLGNEQFTVPFHEKTLEFHLDSLKKPKLEAQWIEQIFATPIKPSGHFPHSLVPHTKLKSAQQHFMSQSMSASMSSIKRHICENSATQIPCSHHMSQSTLPSLNVFTIQQENNDVNKNSNYGANNNLSNGDDVMRQSQIISDMFSKSSNSSTYPSSTTTNEQQFVQNFANTTFIQPEKTNNDNYEIAAKRLENICRRNQLKPLLFVDRNKKLDQTIPLQPVPEFDTPVDTQKQILSAVQQQYPYPAESSVSEAMIQSQMIQSRLFREFMSSIEMQQQMQAVQQFNQFPLPNQTMFLPIQQHQHGPAINYLQNIDFPTQQPPMPTIVEQSNQPYIQQQQLSVTMRPQQTLEPQTNVLYLQNYDQKQSVTHPLMFNRPTSLIMAPNYSMVQNQRRPRSYLDQPYALLDQPNLQQIGTTYSMMATMPVEQQPIRKESFDDEFLDDTIKQTIREHELQLRVKQNDDKVRNSSTPIKFIPICRYQDSQAIRTVSFHPSGGYFAIGTNSRQLLIFKYPEMDAHKHQQIDRMNSDNNAMITPPELLLARPKQHRGSVYCAAFDQSGELLATGSNDKTIRLMNVQIDTNRCIRIGAEIELQHVHDGTVRDLIFMDQKLSGSSAVSSIMISGGAGSCKLQVTDCTTGRTFKSFEGHTAPILGLNNWSSSTNFVSCSQDKTIRFWDLRVSNATSIIWPTVKTSNSPVTSVVCDPSGKLLVSGHEDATIMLYDIRGGRMIQIYRPHGDEVRAVRFSNAAYYLLSGSYDKRILITDMRGNLAETLAYLPVAEHADKVISCRWHPSKFSFLSTSADKSAILWSLPLPLPADNI